jgi:putative phage-type endonuclease
MDLDTIKNYFETNVESFERDLTQLSIHSESFSCDNKVFELRDKYKQRLIDSLDKDKVTNDILYYIDVLSESWFLNSFTVVKELSIRRETIHDSMVQLKQLKLPDQRSPEWYKIRENLLTASSLADALGKGHFQTRDDLLISKTQEKRSEISKMARDIMQWGVAYEEVATMFYEYLNNLTVVEFGLIPHPKLSVFGASPDGICDIGSPNGYEGRMLEIKCPPKRQFTHEVPKHYWMQMQGQLEVCDLEECDFLQVKIEEYDSIVDYEKDVLFDTGIQDGKTSDGLPKGLVLEYTVEDQLKYKYSPWLASVDQILNWKREMVEGLAAPCKEKWWKITRYECTLVRRDRNWWNSVVPDIIQFWADVVHYRNVGNEEVQKRINGRKRGPRKKVFTIQEPMKGYLMDSDEEN